MDSVKTLAANTCQMLIVDFQEKFTPVIPNIDGLLNRTAFAVQVAKMLQIPLPSANRIPPGWAKPSNRSVRSCRKVRRFPK